MEKSVKKYALGAGLALLCLGTARALDVSDLSIHGSLSTTESESDKYNFYGDTADSFDNNIREVTINGAYRWSDGIHAAAQFYGADVDGLSTLDLDFATVDYSFSPAFGIRVGRNKDALGLYGDSQDLDQVRTFANLPLGVYPRNTRTLCYTDGMGFFGSVRAGKAGSVDYSLYGGRVEPIPGDALLVRSSSGLTAVDRLTVPFVAGAWVVWNTPIDGLRIGLTALEIPHLGEQGHLATEQSATAPGMTFSATPLEIDDFYGAGAWNYLFAGRPLAATGSAAYQYASIEYSVGKWVLASEYRQQPTSIHSTIPSLGIQNQYSSTFEIDGYVMATYQATSKVGVGAYYGYTNTDTKDSTATPADWRIERDAAAVVSYAPFSWWLLKVEFHEFNGLGLVNTAGDYNPNAPTAGNRWDYLVLKTTFSF